MLHLLNSLSEVLLPVMYVITVIAYGQSFFRGDEFARKWKSRLLLITFLIHVIYIGMYSVEFHRCMVTTPFEIMSLIAFTITGTYTIVERRTGVRETGFFLLALATLFELISSIVVRLPDVTPPDPILSKLEVGLHVATAIFGFGALALSAVYGLLYLLMYRELKRSRNSVFFQKLPSLESLEHMSINAAIVGFLFITLSMAIGMWSLPRAIETFSYADPKLLVTAFVWFIYLAVLVAKYAMKMDGRKIIALSLTGFMLALFSLTVVNAFFSDFHSFF